MKIIELSTILDAISDKLAVIEAVKNSFIGYSQNEISIPEAVQMLFTEEEIINGDCHIKSAYSSTLPYFCVKVASGFYNNPSKGLAVNNGLVMLFSSETGQPQALFKDDGHMTSARTAAAGALAVGLRNQDKPISLGICGTGHQAELQARWISASNKVAEIIIWGRSISNAKVLAEKLSDLNCAVKVVESTAQLCERANVLVTATPSTEAILHAKDIRPGHHIVALGSDSPGKIELDPSIFERANEIIVDDKQQCLHHGEFGHGVRAKFVDESSAATLGYCLRSDPSPGLMNSEAITVVDLTGLGAQDLALASMVWESLKS